MFAFCKVNIFLEIRLTYLANIKIFLILPKLMLIKVVI